MAENDSDNEMEAAVVTVVAAAYSVILLCRSKRQRICREPSRSKLKIRVKYLNRLIDGDDTTSVNMVRMNKSTFFNLRSALKRKGALRDTLHMSVEEQLLMFLHTIGHNQRNCVIAHNFLRSGETVSRYFNHVLFAIGQLHHEYIKPPSTQTPAYIAARRHLYPYFKDCIGALDGTHIHASVPAADVARFRGRKPFPTQNVLAAVDFDLRFTYVLAGWKGSVHDALVLRNALERPNGLSVPEGKYYLVDAGYATRPGFIAPYRGVRYHLREFGSRTPTNTHELFNLRHSSLRTIVERAFVSLKGRFKILSSRPFFPFKTQVELVLVCCILHNYILGGGEDIFIPSEDEWIPQRPPQNTMREQREEAQEWVAHREQISDDMWANN